MATLGGLGALIRSGTFGLISLLGWALILAVGPFAAVQFWRLRESGRKVSLLLAGCTLVSDAAGLFVFSNAGSSGRSDSGSHRGRFAAFGGVIVLACRTYLPGWDTDYGTRAVTAQYSRAKAKRKQNARPAVWD